LPPSEEKKLLKLPRVTSGEERPISEPLRKLLSRLESMLTETGRPKKENFAVFGF
jgi:hypothetical protein